MLNQAHLMISKSLMSVAMGWVKPTSLLSSDALILLHDLHCSHLVLIRPHYTMLISAPYSYQETDQRVPRSLSMSCTILRYTIRQFLTALGGKCSLIRMFACSILFCRSVVDPRDGTRKALKKMPNVFQNVVSCRRVYRELKMLTSFKHDNVRDTS